MTCDVSVASGSLSALQFDWHPGTRVWGMEIGLNLKTRSRTRLLTAVLLSGKHWEEEG